MPRRGARGRRGPPRGRWSSGARATCPRQGVVLPRRGSVAARRPVGRPWGGPVPTVRRGASRAVGLAFLRRRMPGVWPGRAWVGDAARVRGRVPVRTGRSSVAGTARFHVVGSCRVLACGVGWLCGRPARGLGPATAAGVGGAVAPPVLPSPPSPGCAGGGARGARASGAGPGLPRGRSSVSVLRWWCRVRAARPGGEAPALGWGAGAAGDPWCCRPATRPGGTCVTTARPPRATVPPSTHPGAAGRHGADGRRGSPPPAAGPRPGLRGGCGPARTGCG